MANLLFKKGSEEEYALLQDKDSDTLYAVSGQKDGNPYAELYLGGTKCGGKSQSDWSESDPESDSYIRNKPVLRCISYSASGDSVCNQAGYSEALSLTVQQPGKYQANGAIYLHANSTGGESTRSGYVYVSLSKCHYVDGNPTYENKALKGIAITSSSSEDVFGASFSVGGIDMLAGDQIVLRCSGRIPFCIVGAMEFEKNDIPMTYLDAHTYILSNAIE